MEAGLRTPLLDFFRRGDAARDVRLLAAQGAIAPRPLEQLALLMHLSADSDAEVRATAEQTLKRIPSDVIGGITARADAPTDVREFFSARGIPPAATPWSEADTPLVDEDDTDYGSESASAEVKAETAKRLSDMTIPERVKAAIKGTREMRAILIRDPNRMVASAVLSCPKITEQEVETYARMANVSDEILRTIGHTRAWTKNYGITVALTKNPKTPLALSLTLLHRLNDRDLRGLSIDRNVPEPLRIAARKKVVLGAK